MAPKPYIQESLPENSNIENMCVSDRSILQGKESEKTVLEVVSAIEIEGKKKNNCDTHTYQSSESNLLTVKPTELTSEEELILKAKPTDENKGFVCSCGHVNSDSFFCQKCGARNVATYG